MEAEARSFRERARAENRRRVGTGLRYSGELRLDAVSYLKRKKREGGTLEGVASELGISGWSLWRWEQESESRVALVPVEVMPAEDSMTLSLVTPRGFRVEGLSEERLIRLVERFG